MGRQALLLPVQRPVADTEAGSVPPRPKGQRRRANPPESRVRTGSWLCPVHERHLLHEAGEASGPGAVRQSATSDRRDADASCRLAQGPHRQGLLRSPRKQVSISTVTSYKRRFCNLANPQQGGENFHDRQSRYQHPLLCCRHCPGIPRRMMKGSKEPSLPSHLRVDSGAPDRAARHLERAGIPWGLEPADGPLVAVLFYSSWDRPGDDEKVYRVAKKGPRGHGQGGDGQGGRRRAVSALELRSPAPRPDRFVRAPRAERGLRAVAVEYGPGGFLPEGRGRVFQALEMSRDSVLTRLSVIYVTY